MDILRFSSEQWIQNDIDASFRILDEDVVTHWHDFYEIELIIDGSGTNTIDEIDYSIQSGRIFAMSPTSFHKVNAASGTKLYNLMFTMDLCDPRILSSLFADKPHLTLDISKEDIVFFQILFEELIGSVHSHSDSDRNYCAHLANVFLGKLAKYNGNDILKDKSSAMQRSLLYIQNHFTEQITLEDAAKAANYSANYFSVKCKEYLGMSFKQYVIDLRLSFAANLLKNTNLTVAQIADRCGFRDMTNFLNAFRKRYRTLPKEYRTKSSS